MDKNFAAALYHQVGVGYEKPTALLFNTSFFSSRKSANASSRLYQSVFSGDSPEGCHSLKSVVDHEIGHWLDFASNFKIRYHPKIEKLYNENYDDMKYKLSGYAKRGGVREFIAEAWAEYRNNPFCRPLAKEVGNIMMSVYKRKSK